MDISRLSCVRDQCVMLCLLQVHEKAGSDLSVVPENEPLDSDTEAEKSLVERIKSIKQEK